MINAGLRWRSVDSSDPFERRDAWIDIAAVIEWSAWDSPIRRAVNPDFYQWNDPSYGLEVLTVEAVMALAVKVANQTRAKSSDFLRIPRPNDFDTTKLGSDAVPLSELIEWLAQDFVEENKK